MRRGGTGRIERTVTARGTVGRDDESGNKKQEMRTARTIHRDYGWDEEGGADRL